MGTMKIFETLRKWGSGEFD